MFYLQEENWSPRFDETFFAIKMEARQQLQKAPVSANSDSMSASVATNRSSLPNTMTVGGRNTFPACYYDIQILFGHSKHVLYRRYSQFVWLYNTLTSNPPESSPQPTTADAGTHSRSHTALMAHETTGSKGPLIPIKTTISDCIRPPCRSKEKIEEHRQVKLFEFLDDLLCRPGYVDHPAVVAFLELDGLSK